MKIRLAAMLWQQGVWEALQLQRCVVFFVLDRSGQVLAQFTKCFVVNGLMYLGSIALYHYATKPAMQWLLTTFAEPVYGHAAVTVWQQLLWVLFQLLWLVPLYGISLMISCIWYQQIATTVVEVHQQQQQQAIAGAQQPIGAQQQLLAQLQLKVAPVAAAGGSSSSSSSSSMMAVLEGTAQEVFRVLLFMVFTVEVFIASLLPVVGPVLNVLLLSWLYSYYCYDYKWALQGARLPQRLAYFEANWSFFAGFGFPCVAATAFFPGHIGAALANLLFPVFIMVACGSDPAAAQGSVLQHLPPDSARLDSIPVFRPALWPTYWLTRRLFSSRSHAT